MLTVFRCFASEMVKQHRRTICSSLVLALVSWVGLLFLSGSGYWNILFTHADTRPVTIFVNESQWIVDINDGSFELIQNEITNQEVVSVVLFYAPWSGDSIKSADEFSIVSEKMARTFGSQVQFFAVNCWVGPCKGNLTIFAFPLLTVYHGTRSPITYTGELVSWKMLLFLDKIMRPFTYVGSHHQWLDLIQNNEDYLIGYLHKDSDVFNVYLTVCLGLADRANMPKCCIITNQKMQDAVGMSNKNDIVIYQPLYNASSTYDADSKYLNTTNLLQWVEDSRMQGVSELVPNSTHMATYRNQLMHGPVAVLFLSKALQYRKWTGPALAKFREMNAKYHNCSCLPLSSKHLVASRSTATPEDTPVKNQNQKYCSIKDNSANGFCKTLAKSSEINAGFICDICQWADYDLSPCQDFLVNQRLHEMNKKHTLKGEQCASLTFPSYHFNPNISICCSKANVKLAQGFLLDMMKQFSALNDIISIDLKKNNKLTKNEDNNESIESMAAENKVMSVENLCQQVNAIHAVEFGYNGLACHVNKTVSFHFMDIDRYSVIIDQIGIKSNNVTSMALAIIDIKNEAQYILDPLLPITKTNIQSFVMNFTVGTLERHLRSSTTKRTCDANEVCIVHVTSKTFHETVFKAEKDVLLLYFSPFCGVCTTLRSSYLKVAETVKNVSTFVVARINGDENDLSWPHTVSQYPTIVLYPAYRKHQSVMFSRDQILSPTNILEFSRKHASYSTRKLLNKLLRENKTQSK